MKTVSDQFLAEIESPHWFPIRRAYMYSSAGEEFEITDKVHSFDRILWQIESQWRLNIFDGNNCSLQLKNENEEFDIDNPTNYFRIPLLQHQDGFKTPIQIRVGFTINGTEELVDFFYGHIVDIQPTTDDDVVLVELQCVSQILKDEKADAIGDQWTDEQIFGGNTYTYVNADNGSTIIVANNPSGNFPDGFPPYGLIRIEDEIIYYSYHEGMSFYNCIRAQMNTKQVTHINGRLVELLLYDGTETLGRKFQFLIYPIAKGDETLEVTSSDGIIEILDTRQFINLPESLKPLKGYLDYEKGVLELAGEPTDSASLVATYISTYRQITYHTLVKRLLESQDFDTSLVEQARIKYYLGWEVPTHYGRITHVYEEDGTPFRIPHPYPEARCLCIGADDNLYIGVENYLIMWDEEKFWLKASMPNPLDQFLRIESDEDNNIYCVIGDERLSLYPVGAYRRRIAVYNGVTVSDLTPNIAAYYDVLNKYWDYGGHWRGFSVDDDNDCVWFLYEDAHFPAGTAGLGKVTFGGLITFYDRPIAYIWSALHGAFVYQSQCMDFVDTGDYIEFFFLTEIGANHAIVYHRLHKATSIWSVVGTLYSHPIDLLNVVTACDCTYNPTDNRIYLNILYEPIGGWLLSVEKGVLSYTSIKSYNPNNNPVSQQRFCGGVYHDNYVWYIWGTELAGGETGLYGGDDATGHLYKIANNVIDDKGAMAWRSMSDLGSTGYQSITGQRVRDALPHSPGIREEMKGHGAVMCYRNSDIYKDQALFFISTDITGFHNPFSGHLIGRWSATMATIVRDAVMNNRTIWDVLSELATLAHYELGVSGNGKVFWRKRYGVTTHLMNDINATVTTIPAGDTMPSTDDFASFPSDGLIQIGTEVISYTGKTANSFTGCTRGIRGSTAITHSAGARIYLVHQVIVNLLNEKNLKWLKKYPNWDEVWNYVIVPYGNLQLVFDYRRANEDYVASSEKQYGRRQMTVDNTFLTEDDVYIAETLGWLYYDWHHQRKTLWELDTKWQGQLDLGDILSIKQPFRTLADYVVTRIRRIELNLTDFMMHIFAIWKPDPPRPTIYDAV